MPVIAVVNGKGGSGKSTVATHLAAWCAHQGKAVMLGDIDRQQSTRAWLRRRSAELPTIASWASTQTNTLRVPNGITHVILDTPGGMHGYDLARVVMFADAILMPVGNSIFDREAAAVCQSELMGLPRMAAGRCRLACIGMRIASTDQATQTIEDWATQQKLNFLGILRENPQYVHCLERGMTLFDLPAEQTDQEKAEWHPILDWLNPILNPNSAPTSAARPATSSVRPTVLGNANHSGAHLAASLRPSARPLTPAQLATATSAADSDTFHQIPAFLRQAN